MMTSSPNSRRVSLTHLDGSSDPARLEDLPALLNELDDADDEEFEVAVGDAYGWMVSAYASGTIVLSDGSNPDAPELVLYDIPRAEALTIFTEVYNGDIDTARTTRPWNEE